MKMRSLLLILFTWMTAIVYAKDGIFVQMPYNSLAFDLENKNQIANLQGTYKAVTVDVENALAYLVVSYGVDSAGHLEIFDINAKQMVGTIDLIIEEASSNPYSIVLSSKRGYAYILDTGGNKIVVIDLTNKVQSGSIPLNEAPKSLAISPDQNNLVIASADSKSLFVLSLDTHRIYMTIPTDAEPNNVIFSPNNRRVFFSQANDTVGVFDLIARRTIATIPVRHNPQGLVMNSDGSRVYVACNSNIDGGVSIIDAKKNTGMGSSQCQLIMAGFPRDCAVNPESTQVFCITSLEDNFILLLGNDGIADCDDCINIEGPFTNRPYYSIHYIKLKD